MKHLTIKTKLSIWFAGLLVLLLGIFVPYLYISMADMLYKSQENLIKLHIQQALSAVDIDDNQIVFEDTIELNPALPKNYIEGKLKPENMGFNI